jgi:hypothetical protein
MHMCMYCMYSVWICFQSICACIVCIVCIVYMLYVWYVLAQASTDVSTTSPKDPLLGRHPVGPTQGTPAKVVDHFFPPLGTHPGPVLAHPRARHALGGPMHTPCAANRHSTCISRLSSPPQTPSEMIWIGSSAQVSRLQPSLQHKIPS